MSAFLSSAHSEETGVLFDSLTAQHLSCSVERIINNSYNKNFLELLACRFYFLRGTTTYNTISVFLAKGEQSTEKTTTAWQSLPRVLSH